MKLANYQLVGLNWLVMMHKHKLNGILGDEMVGGEWRRMGEDGGWGVVEDGWWVGSGGGWRVDGGGWRVDGGGWLVSGWMNEWMSRWVAG